MMTKEKPIAFSTLLIPAIQNLKPDTWPPEPIDPGKPWKWQTRQIVKPQPDYMESSGSWRWPIPKAKQRKGCCSEVVTASREWWEYLVTEQLPYPPGTILWVQETFAVGKIVYGEEPDGRATAYISQRKGENDYIPKEYALRHDIGIDDVVWKPPANMPSEAARLFLEVKSARAERLQNINHEDAIAEGTLQWICEEHKSGSYFDNAMRGAACAKPERAFALLWDSIYARRGHPWENNDWVWVYEFMRTEARP